MAVLSLLHCSRFVPPALASPNFSPPVQVPDAHPNVVPAARVRSRKIRRAAILEAAAEHLNADDAKDQVNECQKATDIPEVRRGDLKTDVYAFTCSFNGLLMRKMAGETARSMIRPQTTLRRQREGDADRTVRERAEIIRLMPAKKRIDRITRITRSARSEEVFIGRAI